MKVIKWDLSNQPDLAKKRDFLNFLYTHLESYGDEKVDIQKCLDYTFSELNDTKSSGFVVSIELDHELVGVCIVNETGMEGFIPENILVYVATHNEHRGKGIGKLLVQTVIEQANGNIALHVESTNPAKHLYEKLGFTNKYLEMRYIK